MTSNKTIIAKRSENPQAELEELFEKLKGRMGIGYELRLEWIPGLVKFRDGKQLEEEVIGDTIFIYAESPERAKELLAHGVAEWLLNQYSRPYRELINSLISLFEQQQYERKERIIQALVRLISGW